jgi:hypothetical protein
VKEIPAGCIAPSCVKVLGGGFYAPEGVAVDGNGNVFVADANNHAVKEILAASGYTTVLTLGGGFIYPTGIAVDGSGNVFVSDIGTYAVYELLAADGYATVTTLASNFKIPYGVAVDASGNVYVADTNAGAVYEIAAVNGSIPSTPTISTLPSSSNVFLPNRWDPLCVQDSGWLRFFQLCKPMEHSQQQCRWSCGGRERKRLRNRERNRRSGGAEDNRV